MKNLILLFLTLTSLQSYAQDHRDNPYKEIIRLQKQIQELTEVNTKYSFCVRGLSNDIMDYGVAKLAYGAYLFKSGSDTGTKAQDASEKAYIIFDKILSRCVSLPGFSI